MQHEYVSVGSACDCAMMLDFLRLRKKSYPFDWLWNMDEGLEAVNSMLDDKFARVLDSNSYIKKKHYRLPEQVVLYRDFPSIIHMHSDPMSSTEEHETLVRRIARFMELLSTEKKIHFLYYKNYNEEKLKDSSRRISDTVRDMKIQGKAFLKRISDLRILNSKTHLTLVLQTDKEDEIEARALCKQYSDGTRNMSIAFTISRYDDNKKLHSEWERSWLLVLLLYSNIPLKLAFSALFVFVLRRIKKHVTALAKGSKRILTSSST